MEFEWDEKKDVANQEKYGVPFEKAQDAFFDDKRIILLDTKHSESEKRYFCIGQTTDGILIVRFTMRNENIRIFGADYWRQGKKIYEDKYVQKP